MRYLVTAKDHKPFFTSYYTSENCFIPEAGMVVYDLVNRIYTEDGENWQDIDIDHL